MPNELAQKPLTPILDRFKALLKQRDDELKTAGQGEVAPPRAEEVVQLYEVVLSELTFNSKPIITDLTIIAGELRDHGEGIADAICARIIEVPVEQKLPSLYLLDSIVKNIGREYVRHFSSRLPEVFCEAYKQVHPNLYPAMRHLFGTWSTVFPLPVLRKIETQLQFSSPVNQQSSLRASESPRPTHGIHVNPKYLRQLESSTTDNHVQNVRERSSDLKVYGQNPSIVYDEFDLDHSEGTSSQVGAQRFNSAGGLNRPSMTTGDGSPRRFADVASPANSVFDHGLARMISRENETSEWRRKHYSDNNHNRFEMSAAYNLSNGHDRQGPRALIDAYGSDNSNRSSNNKPLQVERLDVNGMGNKVPSKSWQNTEEEEFDWEDMSPTLTDSHRSNDFLSSSVLRFGNVGSRPGFGKSNASLLKSDIPANLSGQGLLPLVDDTSITAEDAVVSSSGRGSTGLIPGIQTDPSQILGSRYPQETWNRSHHFPQAPQPFTAGGRGKNLQVPISATGVSLSGNDKMASLVDRLPDADPKLVRTPVVASRLGSASLDSAVLGVRSATASSSSLVWPLVNVHKSHPLPVPSIYPLQKQAGNQIELLNSGPVLNQGQNKSLYMPEQQFDGFANKELNLAKVPAFPNHLAALNQRNQLQLSSLQSQFLPSHESRENFRPSAAVQVPAPMRAPSFNHGYMPQGQNALLNTVQSNQVPTIQPPLQIQNIPTSLRLGGGALPPLPRGPPPPQMVPGSQSAGLPVPNQPGSAFSGLISSLMAQGLISLTNQPDIQDSLGLEFNMDLLKGRHESAISALYADLPRQCTTCGLRFKCQEAHSMHMDWHVTKNRMSKNRKQKPSRKWFVNTSMWLSGAEALGTEAVPGFLPAEAVVEKKDDEELAVPADEDQSACALCGEPFDDFYSDETEEWMYKGAVYMNAPDGSTASMDRSQLGPIVHAKCRSESTVVPPEDFGHDEGGDNEGSSQRKRMRS